MHDPSVVAALVGPYVAALKALGGGVVFGPPEAAGGPLLFMVAIDSTGGVLLD